MAEKRRDGFAPPALGGSSLLVAFAVLALTVFALLSLSTVRADVRLADASARAVTDYYAADCEAQEILARIRQGGPVPEGVEVDGGVNRYAVPISDTQELLVEVRMDWGEGFGRGPAEYTILRWQAVPTGDWTPDDSLVVWDGEIE